MSWGELETGAPEIARLGRKRLDEAGVALLGTLRRDGSPRVSPVEPFIVEGTLLFGVMTRSAKARDLLRDPRVVLHSAVSRPDGSEGELKLYGRAEEVRDRELRDAPRGAWWLGRPQGEARVLALRVEQAVFVSWDTRRGLMVVRRWSPELGPRTEERAYP